MPVAPEKMDEVKAEVMVVKPSMAAVRTFLRMGQFCECNGSLGPSNSTTYSSRSGSSGGKGFPAPKLGSGREARLLVRERMPPPTVPPCWLRAVAMRLSAVGCRSRSLDVDTRLMLLRRMAALPPPRSDDVDETDEAVGTRSISLLARRW